MALALSARHAEGQTAAKRRESRASAHYAVARAFCAVTGGARITVQ